MDETQTVRIEQKLEAPGRLLFFTLDDAAAFLVPSALGFISRSPIGGAIVGIVAFILWRKLKGEGGLERLKAAAYWYMPPQLSPYRSFPRSDVTHWRG